MATVTLLYAAQSIGSGYTTISGSATFTLSGGETLAIVMVGLANADVGAPTDSAGTLVKQTAAYNAFASSGQSHGGWYTEENAAAGSHTITPPTIASGNDGLIGVLKIDGMPSTLNVRDAVKKAQISSSNTFSLTTTGTPQVGDVVVGARWHENSVGSTDTITQPSGWTSLWQYLNGSLNLPTDNSYVILGSAGNFTATWTDVDPAITDTTGALLVLVPNAVGPTINTQPANQFVANGAAATFTVSATTSGGSLSYQWQDNSSGSFADIGGETSASLTVVASAAMNGRLYRVNVTDSNGTTTSSSATLFVRSITAFWPPRPITQPPFKRAKSTLWLLDPSNWGGASLNVGKWFADEMPTGSVAGGTHPSTGALSAQSATIAGTATHFTLHPTTGALSAQAATIAGTATHLLLHTTTGALSAQAATIAGSAAHQHAATGALSAQASTLAGTAAHLTLHTSTGALSAQAATISGAAQHQHASTGVLSAQSATISGAADHTVAGVSHSTSGSLSAQAATVAGAAAHLTLHTSTGALTAQAATISGAAAHEHASVGALSAQSATISGAADHTVPGATHSTSGALVSQDAALAGSAAHLTLHTTTGAIAAQASTIAGAAVHPHTSTGALSSQSAIIAGATAHEHATAGALASQVSTITGTATHTSAGTHDASGAMQAQSATIAGIAVLAQIASNVPAGGSGGYEHEAAIIRYRRAVAQRQREAEIAAKAKAEADEAQQRLAEANTKRQREKETRILNKLRKQEEDARTLEEQLMVEIELLQRAILGANAQQTAMQAEEEEFALMFALTTLI